MRTEAEDRAIKKWEENQVVVKFRLPKEDAEILKLYAESNGMSLSGFAKLLITEELDCIKQFDKKMDDGIDINAYDYGKELKTIVEDVTVARGQSVATYSGYTSRTRTTYHKIIKSINAPRKKTVLKDTIPSLLKPEEFRRTLKRFGYCLSPHSFADVLIGRAIFNDCHDLHILDDYLEEKGLGRYFDSDRESITR